MLLQQVVRSLRLRDIVGADVPTHSLVLSEVWQVPEERHRKGSVEHTVGFPLNQWTYGSGAVRHMGSSKIAISLLIGLDYRNPYLSPFEEFQRWKRHPHIRKQLEGGECIAYDAHTLPEGVMP